ncbi:MAG TPA: helix-turn-helix domain-containing protein, partial [Stenomitos sp.]
MKRNEKSERQKQLKVERESQAASTEHRVVCGIGGDMPLKVQERVEGIQTLLLYEGREGYVEKQRELAEKLGISQRSVQRLVKRWREEGLKGLQVRPGGDQGQFWVGEEWEKYIIKTYREGNLGSSRMTPAQVAVRVKAKAQAE